jgi:hypothetical protein
VCPYALVHVAAFVNLTAVGSMRSTQLRTAPVNGVAATPASRRQSATMTLAALALGTHDANSDFVSRLVRPRKSALVTDAESVPSNENRLLRKRIETPTRRDTTVSRRHVITPNHDKLALFFLQPMSANNALTPTAHSARKQQVASPSPWAEENSNKRPQDAARGASGRRRPSAGASDPALLDWHPPTAAATPTPRAAATPQSPWQRSEADPAARRGLRRLGHPGQTNDMDAMMLPSMDRPTTSPRVPRPLARCRSAPFRGDAPFDTATNEEVYDPMLLSAAVAPSCRARWATGAARVPTPASTPHTPSSVLSHSRSRALSAGRDVKALLYGGEVAAVPATPSWSGHDASDSVTPRVSRRSRSATSEGLRGTLNLFQW